MRRAEQKRNIFIAALLCLAFLLCCVFYGLSGVKAPTLNEPSNEVVQSSRELQIFDTGLKLTQDEALSRIKAEYLKQNGGYREKDSVIALVSLKGDAIIDTYLDSAASETMTAGAYAKTRIGAAQARSIKRNQNAVIEKLFANGLINSVENRYDTVMNGFSVSVEYGKIEQLKAVNGVESVILCDTYNRPQTAAVSKSDLGGGSGVINPVDVYETGIFNAAAANKLGITGRGTSVAVLDSGFDCSHTVFSRVPEGTLSISRSDVEAILPDMNASTITKGLGINDVWYSEKIPFMYDYADKDYDVFPYDSEHGTHVAGIIGGHDPLDKGNSSEEDGYVIRGVATDTQLVLMKVFPDLKEGAETDDILAALEDAVKLEVDCINLSLGSSCGFAREEDGNKINDTYDKIEKSGISLLTAASNSYSSAFGGSQGNTNMVTNPDSSTVGSPSTYKASLSVASISGVASRYLLCNDTDVVFFRESSSITGDENDFISELYAQQNIPKNEERTYEYVTVPGYGSRVNYTGLNVNGKIALVRRGSNTFEDKALQAKVNGAVAIIIYNNVEGEISMSMGKSDHIPCVSISKEVGTRLATRRTGTMKVSLDYQAGPFMSDFSSWGPNPDLELKPEITAHGGKIRSCIPGGGYDDLSGTSMATPNLCGAVVLIRQFLKDKFPDYSPKQIVTLANRMLMSTATIMLNEQGTPYSPRKQGAGLSSLNNVIATKAYIFVDGKDKTKLDLLDDPERTGVYDMKFNVVNISDQSLDYNISLVGMTETVSTSDTKFVAETGQLLSDGFTFEVENGVKNGNKISIAAGATAQITLKYTLTDADKNIIDSLFPYGMYVEGFVKLVPAYDDGVDLNVPFLAFYGDWTQAPLFDKTYYDVESEAHDESIDDEDKIKADYFATTPYGSYFYNYIIPLGAYLYDVPAGYDAIPATEEHIAVSDTLATIDGFSAVYGGLLRNAKTMTYTITDKLTGEVIKEFVDHNARKAFSQGGSAIPYFEFLNWKSAKMNLVNNRVYEFKMVGLLDYGDGGVTTNMNNTFKFDFTFDNEAPIIKSAVYEKTYDSSRKRDRYYVTLTLYDNHYVQSVTPIIFNSTSSYTVLTDEPIPVYSEKGVDNKVRIEITDYLDDISYDALITSSLAFMVDDYALNSNIFLCQLPGTRGEFMFTKSGEMDGTPLTMLTIYENEIVDLTQYLATDDETVDENKDYLKHLLWNSSNTDIAVVQKGLVRGVSVGRSTITVTEQMNLKRARLLINVKAREEDAVTDSVDARQSEDNKTLSRMVSSPLNSKNNVDDVRNEAITDIRFTHFETKFAYSRAAQTSAIGATGSRFFINSFNNGVSFYPGEKIQLNYEIKPWYVADKYQTQYASTNEQVATVDENGLVTGLSEGSATISLRVIGSNLIASLNITIKNEFVIDNRTLIAYKGNSKTVKIPDDEGILYIGAYAFCLYDTDQSIELTEEDYDANKIPMSNPVIEEVIIPKGVEDIQKYAFYNCPNLKKVTLGPDVKIVREYCFYGDAKLENINLEKVYTIGERAFYGCKSLNSIDVTKAYTIGKSAFENCISLKGTPIGDANAIGPLDLTALRNTGDSTFRGCKALTSVKLTEFTKLSKQMFAESGLVSIDIFEKISIPEFLLAHCENLETIVLHNDLYSIEKGAFCSNPKLTSVTLPKVTKMEEQVFYDCEMLEDLMLPDCEVSLGNYLFLNSKNFTTLRFGENTVIADIAGAALRGTKITSFVIPENNKAYKMSTEEPFVGKFLLNAAGDTILFAADGITGEIVIPAKYKHIGAGAFSGLPITKVTLSMASTSEALGEDEYDMTIGAYAFAACEDLVEVILPTAGKIKIGARAFNRTTALTAINLDSVDYVDKYAFGESTIGEATVKAGAFYGEGAFLSSHLTKITVGANAKFDFGAFQNCRHLTTVEMPSAGGVHFGRSCFSGDTALYSIDLSKHDAVIEDEVFYYCTALKTANLDNVTTIGNYAFADCKSLTTVTMPKAEKIGDFAFGQYDRYRTAPQITSIVLPETLTEMGEGVFFGCSALKEATLSSSLTSISDYTFGYCISLTKVTMPAGIKKIGVFAFAGSEALYEIDLSHVEEFADYAFTSCKALSDVALTAAKKVGLGAFADTGLRGIITANDLSEVGSYAFQNAGFISFSAPSLISIGMGAFQHNKIITSFTFSKDIAKVGAIAFNGCTALKSFYYADGEDKSDDGVINDYALLDHGVLYVKLPNGDLMLESVPAAKEITTLTVRDRTVVIDFYAGNENAFVESVVLPGSVRSIGNYAFNGYKKLLSVEFHSATAPVLESSYVSDAKLAETDPGYGLLHNQFDLFGEQLCYFTFKDLAGKADRIAMILPSNDSLSGYDSAIFEAYFGTLDKAIIGDYVAMDSRLAKFIDYAKQIMRIETITMSDETLVDNAMTELEATNDTAVSFGYTDEEWNSLVKAVRDAKNRILELKHETPLPDVPDTPGAVTPDPTPGDGDVSGGSRAALILTIIASVMLAICAAFVALFAVMYARMRKNGKNNGEDSK